MRLHEYYFDNLTVDPKPLSQQSRLYEKIVQDFGRFELWERGFKGTGVIRGVGWVILAYDAQSGRLFNLWLDEHDMGLLVGTQPLLVMDVFEHAFLLDYGLKRNEYEDAFFNVVDWEKVENRLITCLRDRLSSMDERTEMSG